MTALPKLIKAVEALTNCYDRVSLESFQKMNESEQLKLCLKEKDEIKEILKSDKLKMSHLLDYKLKYDAEHYSHPHEN